jgi:uracil-DNA glycosylase family 4
VTRTLADAAAEAADCTRCRLANGRTQVVFGVGNAHADVMFIGEAPGFHEDKQGEPFVGAAGQLLTRMLSEVVGVAREDVYICNVLKCRPPGNRDPQDDEIESCTPWLVEQVSLIQPRVIATLGNFATKFVLQTSQGITRLRGSAYPWHGRTVIPTFHPAAILRGGGETSRQFGEFRADFELIRDTLARLESSPERTAVPDPATVPKRMDVHEAVPQPEPVTVPEAEPVPEEQLELF